ncbi:MAG: BrnT family toxin, partial [bacterium]|nr:BrnT family toxin [bacterium]
MEFEWDPNKAAKNFRKHRVPFSEAATIFGDTLAIDFMKKILGLVILWSLG